MLIYGKPYDLAGQEEMEYLIGTEAGGEEGSVVVEVNSSTLPGQPDVTAQIAGSQENYILRISDNNAAGETISSAYRRAVSGGQLRSLQTYDIKLYDAVSGVPITKLGRQRMTITVPKPNGVLAEGLKVVCLDGDGQLERVESSVVTVNGQQCVQFQANHFSVYGICN